ncbi:hypothetical protein [Amycolatopsis suaedae]|uniref:Uncharacterized protein n=1 Tax=Amycolatopsis suaedae TaxID=2510978 RepID=A0A4Q7J789_9PSEU|nr:hypothetical protein [Amycolatopsis suaedae]RZQ63530.1 hypothetical protein EWH70_13985 [Amycolatopsis suaedae]
MTNPYGYQAQQPPPPGYGYGYPAAQQSRPGGGTAITAAIFGLFAAIASAYIPIRAFIVLPSGAGIGDLPGEVLTVLALYLGAALLLLIGALVTFFRAVFGAILLILGSVLTLTSIMLEPALFPMSRFDRYFEAIFTFDSEPAIWHFAALVLGVLTLLFAILPPTFKYLTYKPRPTQPYGQPPMQGYPPQTW